MLGASLKLGLVTTALESQTPLFWLSLNSPLGAEGERNGAWHCDWVISFLELGRGSSKPLKNCLAPALYLTNVFLAFVISRNHILTAFGRCNFLLSIHVWWCVCKAAGQSVRMLCSGSSSWFRAVHMAQMSPQKVCQEWDTLKWAHKTELGAHCLWGAVGQRSHLYLRFACDWRFFFLCPLSTHLSLGDHCPQISVSWSFGLACKCTSFLTWEACRKVLSLGWPVRLSFFELTRDWANDTSASTTHHFRMANYWPDCGFGAINTAAIGKASEHTFSSVGVSVSSGGHCEEAPDKCNRVCSWLW